MSNTMWGGRFTKATHPLVERYASSIAVDQRLARYDVLGSIAHAKMLGRCRIIPARDSRRLVQGLRHLLRAIERGVWRADPRAEDVHTQIEQQLERLVGLVARALHTARSRNDQVSTDLRLYCRDAVRQLDEGLARLQRRLVITAAAHAQVIVPGYTHLQRAQPVLWAHHLLAYVEMLERDRSRLQDARRRIDVLPLGAGALAGTSLSIDRAYVARQLGFPRVAANSIDAVSDRDFALELVFAVACLGVHLSRLGEELILWTSEEFGWLELDDAVATGSSLMPHKKNPDVPELVRGQAGLAIGQLAAFLSMMKGLPLAYNRDLQWDKPLVFGAVDAGLGALEVLECVIAHARVRPARMAAAAADDRLCTTDLAEFLVERGVAFRNAHRMVGELVALAARSGRALQALPPEAVRRIAPQLTPAVMRTLLNPRRSVARKRSIGSTNPQQVAQALRRWQRRLRTR